MFRADFSKSLKTNCRRLRSPVHRWGDWLLIEEWKQLPASHSVMTPFLWRLKEEGNGTEVALSLTLNQYLNHWEINFPLNCQPETLFGLFEPYSVFLDAHIILIRKLSFFGTVLNPKVLHTFNFTFYFPGACRSTFVSYTQKRHLIIGLLSKSWTHSAFPPHLHVFLLIFLCRLGKHVSILLPVQPQMIQLYYTDTACQ